MNFKKWLLNEVSKELVKQVKDAVKNKEKPFKHIFKGNDRIVLPYESITEDEKIPLEIIKKTKKDGYDIDFTTGLISKDKVIPAQYAQQAKPAKIQIKMGRYIFGKGNFTEEEKSWWTHQGEPIKSLQIPIEKGGGPASSKSGGFHWGPSVSWNTYLNCWVMLMGHVEGQSWIGDKLYISFNYHKDLGINDHSQKWTKPQVLVQKPGHVLWYPSLQPMNTKEDIAAKNTSLKLGKKARLFFKYSNLGKYFSEYIFYS